MLCGGRTKRPSPSAIVHLFDWHAALTPAYIEDDVNVRVVLTVQNFMFQGRFPIGQISQLELKEPVIEAGRFFSGFSFLQAGLQLSDVLTTASDGYINDLKQRDRYNWYYLRKEDIPRLIPIRNWADTSVWNPEVDQVIAQRYGSENLARRRVNRERLQDWLCWERGDGPILFTLSRITKAKGFPFFFKQVERLLDRDCRIVIAGEGERALVNQARNLAARHKGRVALATPYNEEHARLILGGADILVMPSLTEPCGISQQHAQIYGCVPIVSTAGGLRNTVKHGETGFLFKPSDRRSFFKAIDAALEALRGPNWLAIQRNCMRLHSNIDRNGYAELLTRCLVSNGSL